MLNEINKSVINKLNNTNEIVQIFEKSIEHNNEYIFQFENNPDEPACMNIEEMDGIEANLDEPACINIEVIKNNEKKQKCKEIDEENIIIKEDNSKIQNKESVSSEFDIPNTTPTYSYCICDASIYDDKLEWTGCDNGEKCSFYLKINQNQKVTGFIQHELG